MLICCTQILQGDIGLHINQISTSTIYVLQVCRASLRRNEGTFTFTTFSACPLVVMPYHNLYDLILKSPTNVTHVAILTNFQMTVLC